MRKAVEAVRGQGTTPLPQHPASHAQSSSSNSRLGSSANRGPSSMPSTSGRPLHASGPPTGRPMHPSGGPPGRMAASHHPHRPTTLARPTASDASRHPAQGMPAWMQKAKQAGDPPNSLSLLWLKYGRLKESWSLRLGWTHGFWHAHLQEKRSGGKRPRAQGLHASKAPAL